MVRGPERTVPEQVRGRFGAAPATSGAFCGQSVRAERTLGV
jgi:hypothetical protein